jgi:hypothetical protein
MLYCNDELVKINSDEYKYLQSEFNKIRKMKNPIFIRTTNRREINPTGVAENIPSHIWPLKATVLSDDGQSQSWVYTKNTPTKDKDGNYEFKKGFQINQGLLTIDPIKETDKAYFILKLSGLIQSGQYEVEDLEKKDTEEVKKLGANAAIEYFVCNKFSPLYSDHRKLKQLAASWGIQNSANAHIDTVRKQLVEKIYASQANYEVTKRGVEEFIAEVNGQDPFTEYRSLIQFAIDKEVIGWEDKTKGWYFLDLNSKQPAQVIVFVPANQLSQKNVILFDFMRVNAYLFEQLKKAVGDNEEKEEEEMKSTPGFNKYDVMSFKDKKELAKTLGIDLYHKSEEKLTEELKALETVEE